MAKDTQAPQDTAVENPDAATNGSGDAPAKKDRTPSTFHIIVRQEGQTDWTMLEDTQDAITQEDAKRNAAKALVNHEVYGPVIQGAGLELAAVSARGFKPLVVKVEPQEPKLVLR